MITVSDLAAAQMRGILEQQQEDDLRVRVYARPHGHQVQFGMGLDNELADDDVIVDVAGGIAVVIDADSVPFVEGAEIDYIDALMGKGFTITNPRFGQGCGCGGGGCGCGGGGCGCGGHGH